MFFMAGLMETAGDNYHDLYHELKDTWSPALPTIRFEPSYQYVFDKINGIAGSVEAGYLLFGADAEYLQYIETGANADLKMMRGHFLLRTAFGEIIGANLALGARSFWGKGHHTGFDVGLPFYIFLGKHFIFDIQPFMAFMPGRDVYDLGAGVSYKYKWIGARVGYRMLKVGGETLHGPRAGIFFQY